jgi:hypothetical protein
MRNTAQSFALDLDRTGIRHIISGNLKDVDEDEYARYDGTESRRLVQALPETTAQNGPRSCRAKEKSSSLSRDAPVIELGYRRQRLYLKQSEAGFSRRIIGGIFG